MCFDHRFHLSGLTERLMSSFKREMTLEANSYHSNEVSSMCII